MLALINHLSVDVLRIVQRSSLFLHCLVEARQGKSFSVILEFDDDVKIKRKFAHLAVKSRNEEPGKKSVFFNKNPFRVHAIVYRPNDDTPFLVRFYNNKYYPLKTMYDVSCIYGKPPLNMLNALMHRHHDSDSLGDGKQICRNFNQWQDTMCYSAFVTESQRRQSSAAILRVTKYFDDLKKFNQDNTEEFQRALREACT